MGATIGCQILFLYNILPIYISSVWFDNVNWYYSVHHSLPAEIQYIEIKLSYKCKKGIIYCILVGRKNNGGGIREKLRYLFNKTKL